MSEEKENSVSEEIEVKKEKTKVSDEILNMTKEEALKYMGLPSNSTLYAIDDKFWQLSKRYRSLNTEEGEAKLDELSAVYDIATGERDKRNKKQEIRDSQKKYWGKTSDEWRTYFSYTWYKYLIAVVALVLLGNLFYNMFLKPRYDVSVVALGHMSCEVEVMEGILVNDCGYTNPYVNSVDVVPDNDEGQTDNGYGDQTAATVLMSQPDVIIADTMCVNYYFNNFVDCSDLYEQLRTVLSPEAFSKLTPVYYSEREYQIALSEYQMSQNMYEFEAEEEDFSIYDPTPVMIGIKVEDPAFITSLGFENLWHYKPAQLVFGIGAETNDQIAAAEIIIKLFERL